MRLSFLIALVWLASSAFAKAQIPPPVDFNRDIRPILAGQCSACHGPDEKARKADLRLDLRDSAVKSGAIVPGKPAESELFKRITSNDPDERMPPTGSKKPPLTPARVELLRRWIADGAKYSEHWSFGKLTRPPLPVVKNSAWIATPVDTFILTHLETKSLPPSPEAGRATLIRRLSLDLTGLPPTSQEVRDFVGDRSPDAYEKVVDRLLASPHYGERMAVYWLDLVRYADSVGYHSDNPMNVAPYRDYIIKSFNDNLPFDRFTIEQLAGDLLPNADVRQKTASAYNRLLQTTEEGGAQPREYEAKYAADRVRNYGQVWLGATIMCAECHNHKFDPYTAKDFYSLAAFFADVQEPSVGRREAGMPIPTPEQDKKLQSLTEAVPAAQAKFDKALQEFMAKPDAFADVEKWGEPKAKKGQPATVDKDVKAILDISADKRTQAQKEKLAGYARANAPQLRASRESLASATKARTNFENSLPHVLVTHAGPPRTVRILHRGNWLDTTGPVVTPNTPGFLPPLPDLKNPKDRHTRLDLARWTVAPNNPLTSRVMANRIWKLFFGRGISKSLEESGTQGGLPSHPELLDWLATEFMQPTMGGAHPWDIKHLIRVIVLTNAYRQSSIETPALREKDPLNLLFAHQSRYRLDAEFVRDNALAVSGLLNRDVGGASVKPYQPAGYWSALNFPTREWANDVGAKLYRRGLYTHWQRTFLHPAMLAFDAPSREECTCERPRSNIPQQALVLLNDPEFVEAARVFAARALADGGADDAARTTWIFERATGRQPKPEETQVLLQLLAKHRTEYRADEAASKQLLSLGASPLPKNASAAELVELAAWTSLCRVVLNLHETITRE